MGIQMGKFRRLGILSAIALLAVIAGAMITATQVHAEYGDVVIHNYSDAASMRPVVFPHWFHRVRFRCKACHADLGFKFKAGGNDINMVKIIDGQFCGTPRTVFSEVAPAGKESRRGPARPGRIHRRAGR